MIRIHQFDLQLAHTPIHAVQGLSSDLKRTPDTLEDLKFVLIVITKIRAMSLDVELQYR